MHYFSRIYGCPAANTIRFPKSSSGALPLKMGTIFCVEPSAITPPPYNAQNPKRVHISSIYRFLCDLLHLPKQHVGNDIMGTVALGEKEPGHGQQFRPCTHMSPLRHAIWRIQAKLEVQAGQRMCLTVFVRELPFVQSWEFCFENKLYCFNNTV